MRRVAITGLGVVTSTGIGTDAFWSNIQNGTHGFVPIKAFDTTSFDVKFAAEVQDWDPVAHGIPKKEARRMDLYTQFASVAASMAIEDSGGFAEGLDPYKIGVLVSSGIGGFRSMEEEHTKYMEKGPGRVSVFFIPMMICNMAGGQIAIEHGYKGENFSIVSACASSTHAIGEAFRKIKYGSLDACVAGGSEAAVTEFSLGAFNNMGTLSRSHDPDRLSIPFDKERGGFVMGDGAGVVILEEMEHAKARGAHIYAEAAGYGATDDAHHITGPVPDGGGCAKAMEFAVAEADAKLSEVDYINAHGTSTQPNDKSETLAVKSLFGDRAKRLAVSSTKSMTGHLLGAAGAVETIICSKSLEEGIIPPTAGYKVPDEECDLDYVTEGSRKADIRMCLSNSLGFGGHNASLAFRKYTD